MSPFPLPILYYISSKAHIFLWEPDLPYRSRVRPLHPNPEKLALHNPSGSLEFSFRKVDWGAKVDESRASYHVWLEEIHQPRFEIPEDKVAVQNSCKVSEIGIGHLKSQRVEDWTNLVKGLHYDY
ncbi:unnamed protein product [Bursaphelenchus xylophilus]|uniref:(pine wood nematode) hypothetical protein n=1 Tax=Bursaphelenchus xylophilus TaxID=6326 RepID=A0A811LWP5_BURXY|nr:unnamed protein product [Bursaphelenchus xylophilus]CAG9123029.1 unnamed protein product [Bursaphelenchus xylophilus]